MMIRSLVRCGITVSSRSFVLPSRRFSELAHRRILNNKKDRVPEPDDDPDYIDEREYLGNYTNLKEDIARNKVAVRWFCYRNLHDRALRMHVQGKTDKNGAVTIDFPEDIRNEEIFSQGIQSSSYQPIEPELSSALLREVRRNLSGSRYLFLNDGALGSHPSIEVPVRFITRDADKAYFLNHFLSRVPLRDPSSFQPELVGYSTSTLSELPVPNSNIKPALTLLNYEKNFFVSSGPLSLSRLQELLAAFAEPLFLKKSVLPLKASVIVSPSTKSPVILIGAPNNLLSKHRDEIFSAQNTLWDSNGIYRVWDGIVLDQDAATNAGDIVETVQKTKKVFSSLNIKSNIESQPSAILFFGQENNKKETDPKSASKLFEKSVGADAAKIQLFESLLASSKAKVYSVAQGSQVKLPELLKSL
jgi:hypothetical protein